MKRICSHISNLKSAVQKSVALQNSVDPVVTLVLTTCEIQLCNRVHVFFPRFVLTSRQCIRVRKTKKLVHFLRLYFRYLFKHRNKMLSPYLHLVFEHLNSLPYLF